MMTLPSVRHAAFYNLLVFLALSMEYTDRELVIDHISGFCTLFRKLSIRDQVSDREIGGGSIWITIAPESELACDSLSWLRNFFLFSIYESRARNNTKVTFQQMT